MINERDAISIEKARTDVYRILHLDYPGCEFFGRSSPSNFRQQDIARSTDYCALNTLETRGKITRACKNSIEYNFRSLAVHGKWVEFAAGHLSGSKTLVTAMVNFPIGNSVLDVKLFEAQRAISDGAREIDFVVDLGMLNEVRFRDLFDEIGRMSDLCRSNGVVSKAILEFGLLANVYERAVGSCIAELAGADFVKTATGFAYSPYRDSFKRLNVNTYDVEVIARTLTKSSQTRIKAAGGIQDLNGVLSLLNAGAERIGTSSAPRIMEELRKTYPTDAVS